MRLPNHELRRNTEAAVKIRKALKTDLSGSDTLKPRCGVGLEDVKARPSGTAETPSLSSPAAQPPCDINHVFADIQRRFLK